MPTCSITDNVMIETEKQLELFLNAIEKSKKNNKSNTIVDFEYISGEKIKELFGIEK